MPEDQQLEQARRDYHTLDKERQLGVDAYCSRFNWGWRDCFIERVSRTKALVDAQMAERQDRLDAHRLKEAQRKERKAQQKRLNRPTKGPPKLPSSDADDAPAGDVLARRERLRNRRVGGAIEDDSGKLRDRVGSDICTSIVSQNIERGRFNQPLLAVPWYCLDEKEADREVQSREKINRAAISQRRRDSSPPPMPSEYERGRTYYVPGSPSTRRV